MALPNIFEMSTVQNMIQRIGQLQSESKALWGSMTSGQMLAHCNVTYEMVYSNKHPQPNFILRFFLKQFVKDKVVSETPFEKNERTSPHFLIKETKNFDTEKARLIEYLTKTQELGKSFFEHLPSNSFGVLRAEEWNNMFYKHLDHHLRQFGV